MNCERRSEPREPVRLPVSLPGGETGLTRDISASGLYFEFGGRLETGSEIALSVSLSDDDRPMRLKAQGRVVRVEPRGTSCGVGVRLLSSTLEKMPRRAGTAAGGGGVSSGSSNRVAGWRLNLMSFNTGE